MVDCSILFEGVGVVLAFLLLRFDADEYEAVLGTEFDGVPPTVIRGDLDDSSRCKVSAQLIGMISLLSSS